MVWTDQLKGDPFSWLLESESPGARYLTLRDLLDRPAEDAELQAARRAAHREGPLQDVLAAMQPEGYWEKPGAGYGPKYRSTVWALILLSQLGASPEEDERIRLACDYYLEHALTPGGQISYNGSPAGTFDCLQGNMCRALLDLGVEASRLRKAFEWMARSNTGEGVAPVSERKAEVRYYAYKCAPGFVCGANDRLPCAWGAVKTMLAFARFPAGLRTPLMDRAIDRGVEFLFSVDPATAGWPGPKEEPNRSWWKFGFPVFYVTDLLQAADALVSLGYGHDPRLANLLELIRSKQDSQGRWMMEYNYTGKTWSTYGVKRKPNKWVTLRALRVLKAAG